MVQDLQVSLGRRAQQELLALQVSREDPVDLDSKDGLVPQGPQVPEDSLVVLEGLDFPELKAQLVCENYETTCGFFFLLANMSCDLWTKQMGLQRGFSCLSLSFLRLRFSVQSKLRLFSYILSDYFRACLFAQIQADNLHKGETQISYDTVFISNSCSSDAFKLNFRFTWPLWSSWWSRPAWRTWTSRTCRVSWQHRQSRIPRYH